MRISAFGSKPETFLYDKHLPFIFLQTVNQIHGVIVSSKRKPERIIVLSQSINPSPVFLRVRFLFPQPADASLAVPPPGGSRKGHSEVLP